MTTSPDRSRSLLLAGLTVGAVVLLGGLGLVAAGNALDHDPPEVTPLSLPPATVDPLPEATVTPTSVVPSSSPSLGVDRSGHDDGND